MPMMRLGSEASALLTELAGSPRPMAWTRRGRVLGLRPRVPASGMPRCRTPTCPSCGRRAARPPSLGPGPASGRHRSPPWYTTCALDVGRPWPAARRRSRTAARLGLPWTRWQSRQALQACLRQAKRPPRLGLQRPPGSVVARPRKKQRLCHQRRRHRRSLSTSSCTAALAAGRPFPRGRMHCCTAPGPVRPQRSPRREQREPVPPCQEAPKQGRRGSRRRGPAWRARPWPSTRAAGR
mmetsp:Transcript_81927/g.231917  ORF Transcript_81927/g.231917 Transcript_81927/m.231917 type:complete len:238 (+) Transcript_81927:840-1553(+)